MQILIDAIYVNNGGGKVLLDYLIQSLECTNHSFHYLLDDRIENKHAKIKESNSVTYLNAGLLKRFAFYRENRTKFSSILCFGNIPPPLKCKGKVFTYFHQPLYIDKIPNDFKKFEKLKFQVKISILNFCAKNSNFWLVQNDRIKKGLATKFGINTETIEVLPFYPSVKYQGEAVSKILNTYIYVSNASPHKNHSNLIEAFCDFYDKNKIGTLTVTVDDKYEEIFQLIVNKQNENYPIINVGFISHQELSKIYTETEFLIFPSFAESFGLGLIEAIENDCTIIASDLPYTHAVCIPSLIFDPYDKDSITNAFERSLEKSYKKSESLVQNKINEIVNLLQNENSKQNPPYHWRNRIVRKCCIK